MSVVKLVFREILKELRLKRGMSQEQLADAISIPHSNIRRYESSKKGHPQIERLVQIADYFGITLDELIGRKEIDNKVNEFVNLSNEELLKATMYYDGYEINEEQKRQFIAIVRGIFDSRKALK